MPAFRNRITFEIVRGIKAYFHLDAGFTHGTVPSLERELKQAQNRIEKQNRQLRQLRKRGQQSERMRKQPPHKSRKVTGDKVSHGDIMATRKGIAFRYLTGSGLEIGALHQPLEVPADVTVRYVDRLTTKQLREEYPTLSEQNIVEVDIVEDGETLSSMAGDSVDFVIANHMIEHCQNPIATLENHLRVLKPGGILYMAVPDKRFTFDCDRPVTSLGHLIRDYDEGAEVSKNVHLEEWARSVQKVPESEVQTRVQHLAETDYSIHFHVWSPAEFLELLLYMRNSMQFLFDIELFQRNGLEFIIVLRKQS